MPENGFSILVKDLLPHDCFPDGGLPRPIVILLGPRGSGRTYRLSTLEQTLGADIVHTRIDLAAVGDAGPLAVALAVARGFSTRWPHRRPVRFHRLEMVELAVTLDLGGVLSGALTGRMRGAFWKMARTSAEDAVSGLLQGVAKNPQQAADLTNAVHRAVRTGFPPGLTGAAGRAVGAGPAAARRRKWRMALDWIRSIKPLQGVDPFDRLVQLGNLPASDQEAIAMAALAEDIRENHAKLASADRVGCQWCHHDYQNRARHLGHHWVLLADNVDTEAGIGFLEKLHGLRDDAVNDVKRFPLLVIGTAGSWLPADFTGGWRPLWETDADDGPPVPTCATAYEAWKARGKPGYLPVRLDPVDHGEMAALVTAEARARA